MHIFTRRDFIKTSVAGTSMAALAPQALRAAEPAKAASAAAAAKPLSGADIVELGKTGVKVSRLAQGTGSNGFNHPSAQTREGNDAFDRLLRHGHERGISFIDMADAYGSHPYVKEAIKGVQRDKLSLLTKIWPQRASWTTPSGGAKVEIDRFRTEIDTDYIDVCLIHLMQNSRWPTQFQKIRDELTELKDKKVVRSVGVSCHDLGAMKVAAELPWVDVILARVNHKCGRQYSCDGTVEEVTSVLKTARKNGKGIIGMKIFAAGQLVKPEEKDASLKFVLGENLVDAITIGMLTPDNVDDTLKRISQVTRA